MPSSARRLGSWLCVGMAVWALPRVGWAEVPAVLYLDAQGACPQSDTIRRQLGPLLPDTEVVLAAAEPGRAARVVDAGLSFTIDVAGARRQIREPARDCVERARIAAVFIALALDPPMIPARQEAASVVPLVAAASPAPEPQRQVSLLFGGRFSAALTSAEGNVLGVGPLLGAAIGQSNWEVAAAASLLTPYTLRFERGSVRMIRAPIELGYRVLGRTGAVTGYLGAGVAADLLRVTGVSFERSASALRLDLGVRGTFGVRHAVSSSWAVFAEVAGAFFPRPYRFELEPTGAVGTAPSTWLALSFGAMLHGD